jgi:predicted transcriptional regulator
MKFYSIDQVIDQKIGPKGTQKRNIFEFDLNMAVIGETIKRTRKERKLTQEQLGALVGVKKSQISKLERSAQNATVETISHIFQALHTKVYIRVELESPIA